MPHSADSTAPSALARRAVQDCRDLAASPGDAQIDDDHTLTDAELSALALAADPDAPIDGDARPYWEVVGHEEAGPLPSWYMPAPMQPRRIDGWRRVVVRCGVASVIASFVAINACGLCNTYGQLHL